MSRSNSAGGGIGFAGALFIAFLVMKLCHVIDWSWWWIFAPLWIPAVIGITAVLIALACIFIISGGKSIGGKG